MKKLILLLICMLTFISKTYSNEKDSTLCVSIELDSVKYSVNMVFENISNDSVLLVSTFKNYFGEYPGGQGFRFFSYYKDRPVMSNWGEASPYYYKFLDGRTHLAPGDKVTFRLPTPYMGEESIKNKYYSMQVELDYRYFILKKRQLKFYHIMTDKLILNWDAFEK